MAENEKELITLIRNYPRPEKALALAVTLICSLLDGATEEELWKLAGVQNGRT